MREYPTLDEVNALLEAAAEYGLDEQHELARPLYFAATGSLAEANAYDRLMAEVKSLREADPYFMES